MRPLTIAKESSFQQEIENYKSISKCSNYDTVAMPIVQHRNNSNPFKAKPGSISCVMNPSSVSAAAVDSTDLNKRSISKSNVFLRAARSITKTKSVSGNFIVKTTICKSTVKRPTEEKDASVENSGTSMPTISKQNDFSSQASPRATDKSSNKYFMSMQMTPNPLIKNSFASPVKEQVTGEFKGGGEL